MSKNSIAQKNSQRKQIIQYIQENGSATIRELFIFCNINSPSKRLSEMRQMGMIRTEVENKKNAKGETKRFCRYYLANGTDC